MGWQVEGEGWAGAGLRWGTSGFEVVGPCCRHRSSHASCMHPRPPRPACRAFAAGRRLLGGAVVDGLAAAGGGAHTGAVVQRIAVGTRCAGAAYFLAVLGGAVLDCVAAVGGRQHAPARLHLEPAVAPGAGAGGGRGRAGAVGDGVAAFRLLALAPGVGRIAVPARCACAARGRVLFHAVAQGLACAVLQQVPAAHRGGWQRGWWEEEQACKAADLPGKADTAGPPAGAASGIHPTAVGRAWGAPPLISRASLSAGAGSPSAGSRCGPLPVPPGELAEPAAGRGTHLADACACRTASRSTPASSAAGLVMAPLPRPVLALWLQSLQSQETAGSGVAEIPAKSPFTWGTCTRSADAAAMARRTVRPGSNRKEYQQVMCCRCNERNEGVCWGMQYAGLSQQPSRCRRPTPRQPHHRVVGAAAPHLRWWGWVPHTVKQQGRGMGTSPPSGNAPEQGAAGRAEIQHCAAGGAPARF